MNRRHAYGLMLAIWVSLLAGCNSTITGQWRSIEPSEVPSDVPRVRQIIFKEDNRFEGRMTQQYRTLAVNGTYDYNGTRLILTPDGGAFGGEFTYTVEKLGDVLLLSQNQATNRLCREPAGAPPAPPALPEEPAQPPLISIPAAENHSAPATRSASAAQRAPATRPATTRSSAAGA